MSTLHVQVHGILESVAPVFRLVHALGVRFREGRFVVQLETSSSFNANAYTQVNMQAYRCHGHGELAHGVEGRRAAVDDLLHELGDGGARGPVLGELGDLLGRGDLAGEEQPEEGLGEGFFAARGLGEEILAFFDGLAAEADALLWTLWK